MEYQKTIWTENSSDFRNVCFPIASYYKYYLNYHTYIRQRD